jgi:hypothetical protein
VRQAAPWLNLDDGVDQLQKHQRSGVDHRERREHHLRTHRGRGNRQDKVTIKRNAKGKSTANARSA